MSPSSPFKDQFRHKPFDLYGRGFSEADIRAARDSLRAIENKSFCGTPGCFPTFRVADVRPIDLFSTPPVPCPTTPPSPIPSAPPYPYPSPNNPPAPGDMGSEPKYTHCSHMEYALPRAQADRTIQSLCDVLLPMEFDTIAFRGISGTIIAPIIAYKLSKEMIMVRKNHGGDCASGRWVEGFRGTCKYIVLDDLLCSGGSVVDTILGVRAFTKDRAILEAIVTYDKRIDKRIDILRKKDDVSSHSTGISFESIMKRVAKEWEEGKWRVHMFY